MRSPDESTVVVNTNITQFTWSINFYAWPQPIFEWISPTGSTLLVKNCLDLQEPNYTSGENISTIYVSAKTRCTLGELNLSLTSEHSMDFLAAMVGTHQIHASVTHSNNTLTN
ncbi:unnamed protein product, partial [Meganyctiphanes norvegica]